MSNARGPSAETRARSHAALARKRAGRINALCDLVADGVPVKAAAKQIGISVASATAMMRDVRTKLGWQAS